MRNCIFNSVICINKQNEPGIETFKKYAITEVLPFFFGLAELVKHRTNTFSFKPVDSEIADLYLKIFSPDFNFDIVSLSGHHATKATPAMASR